MDLKFIIIIGCMILLLVLIMNELNALRRDVQTRIEHIDETIGKYSEDIKNEYKKENNQSIVRFRTMTNEMISQFRTMNNLEKQSIIAISDHFDIATDENREKEKNMEKNIPYLSEMNGTIERKKKGSSKESLYMSNTDMDNAFIIRDEYGSVLPSVKKNANLSDIKEIDLLKNNTNDTKNNLNTGEEIHVENNIACDHMNADEKKADIEADVDEDDSTDDDVVDNDDLKIKKHLELINHSCKDADSLSINSVNSVSVDMLNGTLKKEKNVKAKDSKSATSQQKNKDVDSMISDKSDKKNNDMETYDQYEGRDEKTSKIEKLLNITNYNKQDLISMAKQHNLRTSILVGTKEKDLTKKELYDILSKIIKY